MNGEEGTTRQISRVSLIRLAAGRSFSGVLGYSFAWDVILVILCGLGGAPFIGILVWLVLIDAGIFLFAAHSSFRVKCGWVNLKMLRNLMKNREWMEALKGTELTFRDGGWVFEDDRWFVRINEASACILMASELDFSQPCRSTEYTVYDDFSRARWNAEKKSFERYAFQMEDGKVLTVQTDRPERLIDWIEAHGGIIMQGEQAC